MRLWVRCFLAIGIIMAAGALCYGAQVDSPSYKHWSKFKVGTTVTFKNESVMAGSAFESEMTTTLVSLDAQKAVIETVMKQAGKTMPPTRLEIPAKVDQVETAPLPARAALPMRWRSGKVRRYRGSSPPSCRGAAR